MDTQKSKYNFRCGEIVKGCSWEASANSKEELLAKVEQHGKEQHHMAGIDPAMKKRVEGAITQQAA